LLPANTLDFEAFPDHTPALDSTPLTDQFPGLAFSNATVISAGVTLNELEFPPHSGSNVVFDDGGPISILFSTPVVNVSAFFTYTEPLTLTAFDSNNNPLGAIKSMFSNNEALSGDAGSRPNEPLGLAFASGISTITIAGDPQGGSFVMDDLSFTPAAAQSVPESGSAIPLAIFMGWMAWAVRRRIGMPTQSKKGEALK